MIKSLLETIKKSAIHLAVVLSRPFAGDLLSLMVYGHTQKQTELESDQVMDVYRIGPIVGGTNVVSIKPYLLDSLSKRDSLVKAVLSLSAQDARSPYNFLNELTAIPSILIASNGAEVSAHRRVFAKVFNIKAMQEYNSRLIDIIVLNLIMPLSLAQKDSAIVNIKKHLFEVFCKMAFGFNSNCNALIELYDKLELFIKTDMSIRIMPMWIVRQLPAFKYMRKQITSVISNFFQENFDEIIYDIRGRGKGASLLSIAIHRSFADFNPDKAYIESEIEKIADCKDVRELFILLFPLLNLIHIYGEMIYDLAQVLITDSTGLCGEILRDIDHSIYTEAQYELALKAFYYNNVSYYSTVDEIPRYVAKACRVGGLDIPANSTIRLILDKPEDKEAVDNMFKYAEVEVRFIESLSTFPVRSYSELPLLEVFSNKVYLMPPDCMEFIELDIKAQKAIPKLRRMLDLSKRQSQGIQGEQVKWGLHLLPKPVVQQVLSHCPLALKGSTRSYLYNPFGLGRRSCPVHMVSLQLFKTVFADRLVAAVKEQRDNGAMCVLGSEQKYDSSPGLKNSSIIAESFAFFSPGKHLFKKTMGHSRDTYQSSPSPSL